MALDLHGIHQYTEADDEASFSDLLNLGMGSVSAAKAFFRGPAVNRAALDPAPAGAYWQDTDGQERLWSTAPDGTWRLHEGVMTRPAAAWGTTAGSIWARQVIVDLPTVIGADESIEVALAATTGYNALAIMTITRHADRTAVNLSYMQFITNLTTGFTFTWRVVKAGA